MISSQQPQKRPKAKALVRPSAKLKTKKPKNPAISKHYSKNVSHALSAVCSCTQPSTLRGHGIPDHSFPLPITGDVQLTVDVQVMVIGPRRDKAASAPQGGRHKDTLLDGREAWQRPGGTRGKHRRGDRHSWIGRVQSNDVRLLMELLAVNLLTFGTNTGTPKFHGRPSPSASPILPIVAPWRPIVLSLTPLLLAHPIYSLSSAEYLCERAALGRVHGAPQRCPEWPAQADVACRFRAKMNATLSAAALRLSWAGLRGCTHAPAVLHQIVICTRLQYQCHCQVPRNDVPATPHPGNSVKSAYPWKDGGV